jgi:hypothetical protein
MSLLLTSIAEAALEIIYKGDCQVTTLVEVGKIRADISCKPRGKAPATNRSHLLDPGRKTMTMIDHVRKTYTEVSGDQLKAAHDSGSAKIDEMRGQMKKSLAKLPPGQRQLMEQMMNQQLDRAKNHGSTPPGAQGFSVTYKKVGSPTRIGKWNCTPHEKFLGEKKTDSVCIGDFSQTGVSMSRYQPTLAAWRDFAVEMTKKMGGRFEDPLALSNAQQLLVQIEPVQGSGKTTLESVAERTVAGSTFTVPSGYANQPFALPRESGSTASSR